MDITSRPDPLSESQASPAVPEVGSWVTTPRDVDVLSTKLRTLHRSKGNVFYRELVDKYAAKIDKKAVPDGTRQVAERIVDIITVDRKGVFLRRDGGATRWLVMDRRAAINKVFTAIRTYQAKASAGGTATDKKTCFKKKPPAATKMAGTAKKPPKVVSYQAQAGPVTAIRPYALHLISAVCNQPQTQEALLRVLDKPLLESTDEPEPSRDRTMRLQLRHRYVAAAAAGMKPIDFSRKLLDLWGGTLVQTSTIPEFTAAEEEPKTGELLALGAMQNAEEGASAVADAEMGDDNKESTVVSSSHSGIGQGDGVANMLAPAILASATTEQ